MVTEPFTMGGIFSVSGGFGSSILGEVMVTVGAT
jgi:hypothetical protein